MSLSREMFNEGLDNILTKLKAIPASALNSELKSRLGFFEAETRALQRAAKAEPEVSEDLQERAKTALVTIKKYFGDYFPADSKAESTPDSQARDNFITDVDNFLKLIELGPDQMAEIAKRQEGEYPKPIKDSKQVQVDPQDEEVLTASLVDDARSSAELLALINSVLQRYITKAEEFLAGKKKEKGKDFVIVSLADSVKLESSKDKALLSHAASSDPKNTYYVVKYNSKDNDQKVGVFQLNKDEIIHIRHTKDRAQAANDLRIKLKTISEVINNPSVSEAEKSRLVTEISPAVFQAERLIKEKEKKFNPLERSMISSLFSKDKPSVTDIFIQHDREKGPLISIVRALENRHTMSSSSSSPSTPGK